MAHPIGYGFIPQTREPIDSRLIVADDDARLGVGNTLYQYTVYQGMTVYVQSTDRYYVLENATDPSDEDNWREIKEIYEGTNALPTDNSSYVVGDLFLVQTGSSAGLYRYDGTSWVAIASPGTGHGDVVATGTPADNEVAVWTDANTVEGQTAADFAANFDLVTNGDVQFFSGTTPPAAPSANEIFYSTNSSFQQGTGFYVRNAANTEWTHIDLGGAAEFIVNHRQEGAVAGDLSLWAGTRAQYDQEVLDGLIDPDSLTDTRLYYITDDGNTETTDGGTTINVESTALTSFASHTGDGTATRFRLPTDVNNINNVYVFLNGVYQHKGTYEIDGSDASFLIFDGAPPNGVAIDFNVVTTTGNARVLVYDNFTDTDASTDGLQTTVAVSGGVLNITTTENIVSGIDVNIYINGVYQSKSNYSVTGVKQITFGNGVAFDDTAQFTSVPNIEIVHTIIA